MSMARKPGCVSRLLSGVVLVVLAAWAIDSCTKHAGQADRGERERRAVLTPDQRAEEDHHAAERQAERERLAAERRAADEKEAALLRRRLEAERVSQTHVRRFLKHPDDASFGVWTVPDTRWNAEGTVFHVASRVKARNDFGAELTYRWQTIIFLDGDTWRLVSCIIDGEQMYDDPALVERLVRDAAGNAARAGE